MKKVFLGLLVLTAAFMAMSLGACAKGGAKSFGDSKTVVINDQYSFQYGFVEKPKMGTSTLKINVLNAAGEKTNDLTILASYDMPSMGGHYSAKLVPVAISKNNDYLMPIQMTMRGEWIIVLVFQKDNTEIHTETITVAL